MSLFHRLRRQASGRPAHLRFGTGCDPLEARVLLTTYFVMRTGNEIDGDYTPEDLTLPEAINLANANPGRDQIILRTPNLSNPIRVPLPHITDDLDVTTDFLSRYRISVSSLSTVLFEVSVGVDVTISRVELIGRTVNHGSLTLDTVQSYGVTNGGDLTIVNSSLTGSRFDFDNPETANGGAIQITGGASSISNSTISNSFAIGRGGGIYIDNGTLLLTNVTLTDSGAENTQLNPGGGIFIGAGADVTIHNSIIAGNSGDPSDIAGTLNPASSYNIIGDANAAGGLMHGVNGNIVGNNGSGVLDINTILNTTLDYNGGRTLNHALVPGSPALNSGWIPLAKDAAGNQLTQDQRGFARVSGTGLDRGAFELQVNTKQDVVAFNHNTGYWWLGFSDGGTFSNTQGPRWSLTSDWDIHTGDFNGDGLTDGLGRQLSFGQWWAALANGTTLLNSPFGKWTTNINTHVHVGDFNGDGKDDVVGMDPTGLWHLGTSTGTRFNTLPTIRWSPTGWASIQVADINGDDKDDLIGLHQASGNWWAAMSDGSTFHNQYLGQWNAASGWQNFRVGDFTGDGADDVLLQSAQGYWLIGTLVGNYLQPISSGRSVISTASPTVDDYNGDGLDDLAITNSMNQVFLKLGTGGALSGTVFWGTAPTNRVLAAPADVNADGLADLVYFTPNTGGWITLLSDGTRFTPKTFGQWTSPNIPGFRLKFFGDEFGM